MNSQHKNTNSNGDFLLKTVVGNARFKDTKKSDLKIWYDEFN